jgi:predicted ribosomally synthesized peptide with SipW-like signal peptide
MNRATIVGAIGIVAAGALLVVPGVTWGSFNDREVASQNAIAAGTLEVATGGGGGADHLDFHFDNLLPGAGETANGTYRNIGAMAQDVWLVFADADALAVLNGLGPDVEVHVAGNGTDVFASQDLGEHPLPRSLKLGGSLTPGAGGSFSFGFSYSPQFSANAAGPAAGTLPYLIVATQPGVAP